MSRHPTSHSAPSPETKPTTQQRLLHPKAEDRKIRRVVHVSASDYSGAAARGACRLHHALRRHGEDSRMFVLKKKVSDPTTNHYRPEDGTMKHLRRLMRKEYLRRAQNPYHQSRPKGCEHFRDDRSPFGEEVMKQIPQADIINLHWIAEFIDYQKFFPRAATENLLVWTLHDMNPFTGGCHYDLGCGRFQSQCGGCPQLGSTREKDLSRKIHQRKEQALAHLSNDCVRIVTGSRWLTTQARASSLLSRFEITTIHYGVDTDLFSPRDRSALRNALNIPESAFVVLFAADHLDNQRKGLSLLINALHRLPKNHQVYLLSVGHGTPELNLSLPHIHLGYLKGDDLLSVFYSAGDCFVIPSLQEVFGLTALEAMACATPVVGFATGGIPDMITPGKNGLLARTGDAADLSRKILWMINQPEQTRAMGQEARLRVEREFSIEHQARRYTELYDELTEASKKNTRRPNTAKTTKTLSFET